MTTRSSRKRKRISSPYSVAAPEDNIDKDRADDESNVEEVKEDDEVWESFKEEYSEFFEQLPLSLHRNFALLRELDKQAQETESAVLPAIRQYTRERLSLAHRQARFVSGAEADGTVPRASQAGVQNDIGAGSRISDQESERPMITVAPNSVLPRISTLLFDLVRTSEEKANLAKASYGTVDRHVRLLDQSIKEQEGRLGIGPRPPGLFVSSVPGRRGGQADAVAAPSSVDMDDQGCDEQAAAFLPSRSHGRSNRASHSERYIKGPPRGRPDADRGPPGGEVLSAMGNGLPIDPHEPRYCVCNEVSWGEMIACDSNDCEREWFHLRCVGLTEAPKPNIKWFCTECRERQRRGNSRKRS